MHAILYFFSLAVIAFALLAIFVPYFKGRTEFVSVWSIFMGGVAIFYGMSGIAASQAADAHRADYSDGVFWNYMLGTTLVLVSLTATYFLFKPPRSIAGRSFRKWPPLTTGSLVPMTFLSCMLAGVAAVGVPIPFIGHILGNIGGEAATLAVMLAFVAWLRQRQNPMLLVLFLGVLGFALVLSMVGNSGRRGLLAVLLVFPVGVYWLFLRYRPPARTLLIAGGALAIMIPVLSAYGTIRHRYKDSQSDRDWRYAVESLVMIGTNLGSSDWYNQTLVGGDCVETSLLSIYAHTTYAEPSPFHAVRWVLANPVPRMWWPDKPMNLGTLLPHQIHPVWGTRSTWGPGIVGHAFHEGGLYMCLFYGCLFGVLIRFADEIMLRQAGNPFLLGFLAMSGSQWLGMPRGDIGVFGMQVIGSVVAVMLVAWTGRIVSGTGVAYPVTKHLPSEVFQRGGPATARPQPPALPRGVPA